MGNKCSRKSKVHVLVPEMEGPKIEESKTTPKKSEKPKAIIPNKKAPNWPKKLKINIPGKNSAFSTFKRGF